MAGSAAQTPVTPAAKDVAHLLSGQGAAIPLFKVYMSEDAIEAACDVLRSGFIGQGPRVETFEQDLAPWFSGGHILTLNSGTAALHLALRMAGVGHGDEVISTPMTCMATNVPIMANGATIVWADIDPSTGNLDPASVESKITPKTKAIVCVDWGGYPCDIDALQAIATRHGIKLIEDAAHAMGAEYKGKRVGGLADFTCFSLQAIKHMTTVDGGLLVCKSEEDYRRGKLLRWYGIDREGPRTDFRCEEDVLEYGYKFHMNDVTAAMGSAQLAHLPKILAGHQANGAYLNQHLAPLASKGLQLPAYKAENKSVYWLYTIQVPDRLPFMRAMADKNITVSQVHARNDNHSVFKAFKTSLPGVDKFSTHQVSIPVGWWLSPMDLEHMVESITEYFNAL
jgi:perosamine synthetase